MAKWFSIFLAIAIIMAAACAPVKNVPQSENFTLITAYVDAYNKRDLAAMTALMHPDIQWLSIEGGETGVIADGKADLTAQMSDYMSSPQATQSELKQPIADGRFVAVTEIARWEKSSGELGTQSALTVYEMENALIRRVWYYPSF